MKGLPEVSAFYLAVRRPGQVIHEYIFPGRFVGRQPGLGECVKGLSVSLRAFLEHDESADDADILSDRYFRDRNFSHVRVFTQNLLHFERRHPVALGVLYCDPIPSFEHLIHDQVEEAKTLTPVHDLNDLLRRAPTWTVDAERN